MTTLCQNSKYKIFIIKTKKKTTMKKVIALFAIVALASCGGGNSTETTSTDSTSVTCDTMSCAKDSVKTTDSTHVVKDSIK